MRAELGNKIKQLRLQKGVTQETLAKTLHISCQTVSKWENGTSMPDILLLPEIAVYFGCTIDDLFDLSEQAVAAAAALSAQEKQAVRRDMKWHAVFRLAAALMLSVALVYVSRVLDLHGIYGWSQGCTMGMLPFTGWLAGDAVFTLRQVKKL